MLLLCERSMVSRAATRVGSRIDGVDDASGLASDRAAREAVRVRIVERTAGGDEDRHRYPGTIGRHRVAVAGVWD